MRYRNQRLLQCEPYTIIVYQQVFKMTCSMIEVWYYHASPSTLRLGLRLCPSSLVLLGIFVLFTLCRFDTT